MDNYDLVKERISQYEGMITSKDFRNMGIGYFFVNKLMQDGIIDRVSRGMYCKANDFEDQYFTMQRGSKKIVFSYNTALFFLGKTEVTPSRIDITVPKGYNVQRIDKECTVHYCTKEYFELGLIEIETPFGNKVFSYNFERTICDIIKNRNTGLDTEQINKIIRNAFLKKQIDNVLLKKYAKILKCDRKLQKLTEVLV